MLNTFRAVAMRKLLSSSWFLPILFFAVLLVLGLSLYRDFGMSWDEPTQVILGLKTYRFVMKQDPALLAWRDRLYGPFFEIILVILQSRGASQMLYFSRHWWTFVSFVAGCAGLFGLAKYFFRSTLLALLGVTFLLLSPRIFADAFYNTKDIPFLALYSISLWMLLQFLDQPNGRTALLHGGCMAALLATRLPGLVIPCLTLIGLAWDVLSGRAAVKTAARYGALALVSMSVAWVIFWPAIWPNPPAGIWDAFQMMRNFPHQTAMRYLGQMIESDNLPWHYIPVWLGVTTPIFYEILMAGGFIAMVTAWARAPRGLKERIVRSEAILLGAIVFPLLAVIFFRSTLYDGWRQMYFIYPPLLLLVLRGWQVIARKITTWLPLRAAMSILAGILLVGLLPPATWMILNHPYENVYFNPLAGADMQTIQQRFMLDYWGLAYRKGLEYIVSHDDSREIAVFTETAAGQGSAAMLPTQDETRLHFVSDLSQATYFVGGFYLKDLRYPFKHEEYAIQVGNAKILAVYRLTDEEKH